MIAFVVILAAVAFVAMGRGGELSAERGDYQPLDLGPVSATDVALLRPPSGVWGYNMQATDEALEQIAESIRERDVRIVALEQLVTDLSRDHSPMAPAGSPYAGARHRRSPGEADERPLLPRRPASQAGTDPISLAGLRTTGGFEAGGADPFRTAPGEAVGGDPPRTATAEGAEPEPPRATPGQAGGTEPPGATPGEAGGTDPFGTAAFDIVATESVRLPADPGRPGGAVSGPPPEQSHD